MRVETLTAEMCTAYTYSVHTRAPEFNHQPPPPARQSFRG
jgi:hypothetical protein